MTIPRNDQIKEAIISTLKANANVLVELSDVKEIRENQWQGTDFSYPCIRVAILPEGNKPDPNGCSKSTIMLGIAAFSEEASSKQADRISGIIANELHTQSFSSQGVRFALLKVEMIVPAKRVDEQTWMSEVIISGTANG